MQRCEDSWHNESTSAVAAPGRAPCGDARVNYCEQRGNKVINQDKIAAATRAARSRDSRRDSAASLLFYED